MTDAQLLLEERAAIIAEGCRLLKSDYDPENQAEGMRRAMEMQREAEKAHENS